MAYRDKAGEVNAGSKGSVFDEQFGAASTPAQGSVFEGGDLHTRGPQGFQGIGINTVSGEIQDDGNTLVTVTFSNPSGGATPNPMTFIVDRGEPGSGGGGSVLGFLPPGHEDHSGGENDGEIILGNSDGEVISALPVDVRAISAVVEEDNGLVGIDNGRLVLNVSTMVQADDNRPVTAGAVQTAISAIDTSGADNALRDTPDTVADDTAWNTYLGGGNLGFTKTNVNYNQTITAGSPTAFVPTTIAGGDGTLVITGIPNSITLVNDNLYSLQLVSGLAGYTGTVNFRGSDVTINALGATWGIPTSSSSVTTSPPIPYEVFTSTSSDNTAALRVLTLSGGSAEVEGSATFTGDGIAYDVTTNSFVIQGGGLTPVPFNVGPGDAGGTGRLLVSSNNAGTILKWSNLPGVASAGSGIRGIRTSDFVSTTVQGGGNATWSPTGGLTFDSPTVPDVTKVYQLSFSNVGSLLFDFNGADVQFANNQWNIHPVDAQLDPSSTGFLPDETQSIPYNGIALNADVYLGRIDFIGDGVTFDPTTGGVTIPGGDGGTSIAAYSSSDAPFALNAFVYNPVNGLIYRSTQANNSNSLTDTTHWQSLGGATQFAPNASTAAGNIPNVANGTVGASLDLSSNNNPNNNGLGTPNDNVRIFGTGGISVIADGTHDVLRIDGSGIEGGGSNVTYQPDQGTITIGGDTPTIVPLNDAFDYPLASQVPDGFELVLREHSIWSYDGHPWIWQFPGETTVTRANLANDAPNENNFLWQRLDSPAISDWPVTFSTNFFVNHGSLWERRRKTWEYLPLADLTVNSSNFAASTPSESSANWKIESHDVGSCHGLLGSDGFYARFGLTGTSTTVEPTTRLAAIQAYEALTSTELVAGNFDDGDRIHDILHHLSVTIVESTTNEFSVEVDVFYSDLELEMNVRAEADALESFTREAGDDAERDYVNTTLHVDAADSQSYYQFSGQPAVFTEDAGVDYGITIAMPETIEDTESLVQAENIGQTTKVFKLRLRFNDGANDTKEYVVTTGGYNFTISDERSSETFTLPTIEGTYSAASVHQNGTNTQRQNCFLAIGGWFGRIAQIDMAHVLDVSNGNILTGRTLEVAQDYSEHVIADNNDTAVVGMVFDNQTTGSHTGINAYVLQRHNRIVRYRASASGGLFSFRNGNSVVDRFHPSRVPDVVSQQTVDESNWLGLKMVTIQNAISNTSASGQSNRLTFASGDKMLVAFGDAVDSASAGISIPGIAISKNPSTFAGGNVNLGLFYPGGNDPSEEYSNYSSSNEADFDATIFDMEYSNASGAWTFFFGGESNQATTVETRAAGFHGTSIWNMATVSAATKVGAGGIIRSVALGGNIAGLASDTNFWLTTELGALYITKTPWLGAGYSDSTLIQAHTNPNDPTSDIKRDFTFRGFQYFDQHGSIGAADDGHIYRLIINPEVTFTVTFGNVTHTATYRFNDDTAAMHTFFGTPASYTPTLVNTGVNLTTLTPGSEPADQLYLDFSVNGQNTPVVSYQWVGVLATTDDDFETYNPFRRLLLENTAVDIHYPDGGATYHAVLSSNANDYTAGNETNEAVDQIVAVVNQHTAQGHSAVRIDGQFADTITNTRPVLRLDQAGTHALQNAPTITVVHPEEQVSGTLAVERFADGGYDTIGRPGGLFDPNDYDTRAENDAKIAAIASTHGYAENIVANAGSGDTTYTRLDRLQVGTEIYSTSTRLGELNDAGEFVTLEELTNQTVTFVTGSTITLAGGEITITPDSTYRVVAEWGDEYTGTITFPAAAASNVAGTFVIDTTALGIVYSPPFPSTGFSVTGNSDIQEELGVPTYVGVSGDVQLIGTGVSRNGQVFTFSDTTKANTVSTVVDTDVGLNNSNEIISINVGGTVRNIASSSDHLEIFSGSTQVSDADTTGISFTVGSGSASGLQVADTGANVGVRIGIPTAGTVPSSWDDIVAGEGGATDAELERNTIAAYFAGVGIYLSDTAVEEDASSLAANEYYTGVTIRGPGLTITVPHAYFFDASIDSANDNSWRTTDSLTGTLLGYQGG